MRTTRLFTALAVAVLALTASSCYTQLETVHTDDGYYSRADYSEVDRTVSGERSLQQNRDQVVSEEDYLLGYDDGWEDAEAYYFKDYEAKRWYQNYGVSLAHDPYLRNYIAHDAYRPYRGYYFYSPYRFADPYFTFWPSYSWRWNMRFGIHVGFGWGWHSPYYAFYDYYTYPHYYPYYGGWGYWGHRPFYSGVFYYNYASINTTRNYGPRGTGLVSRGSETIRRTRSNARVSDRTFRTRSDIRSNARDRNVSRVRGTVGSRSSDRSTVRNRSAERRTNRGTVNRSRSSSSNRGTVNRSRSSSSNRGTVNRSRSSSSNRGTVNRSRSSSSSRGSVNRSRSSSSNRSSANRSRSSSRDRSDAYRSSLNSREMRSGSAQQRVNRDAVLQNRRSGTADYRSSRSNTVQRNREAAESKRRAILMSREQYMRNQQPRQINSNRSELSRRSRVLNSIRNRISTTNAERQDYTPYDRNMVDRVIRKREALNRIRDARSFMKSIGRSSSRSSSSRGTVGSSSRSGRSSTGVRSSGSRSSSSRGTSSRSRSSSSGSRGNN